MTTFDIHHGDALNVLRTVPDNSVDAIVTDPPYFLINNNGSGFMGKEWDGIMHLWKYLWVSEPFASIVTRLLQSLQIGPSSAEESIALKSVNTQVPESARLEPAPSANQDLTFSFALKNGSVHLLAVTKREVLDWLRESLGSLTATVDKSLNGVDDNALFAIPLLLPASERNNIAVKSVIGSLKVADCRATEITFTGAEIVKIKNAIVAMGGNSYASKYTNEINGIVAFVESTATEKKFSATILRPTKPGEVMRDVTLLLYAMLVTHELSKIPRDLIISFFKAIFQELRRVLKPGGHVLAFGGTRTYHLLATAIEDAGFECRDMINWVYGSGFPKSHNLKDEWNGWGTALKPAHEPIVLARKPLIGTVAENVQAWGCGALNVDGCRVGTESTRRPMGQLTSKGLSGGGFGAIERIGNRPIVGNGGSDAGRWPANLITDGSEEVVEMFPVSKDGVAGTRTGQNGVGNWGYGAQDSEWGGYGGGGSAARFFYAAKASRSEREAGLDGMPEKLSQKMGDGLRSMVGHPSGNGGNTSSEDRRSRNHHPTVKPQSLMKYLCRLITPPNGVILDPFFGSGSTGVAAITEGFSVIGIEREAEYVEIAQRRCEHAARKQALNFTEAKKRHEAKAKPQPPALPLFDALPMASGE